MLYAQMPGKLWTFYLRALVSTYTPARSLRLSDTNLAVSPGIRKSRKGGQAFFCLGPKRWNALPPRLRVCQSLSVFRKSFKTWLFQCSEPL